MGGEAVLFTPAVGLALGRLLTLLLIPVVPITAALRAVRMIGPTPTRWTPAMEISALVLGCLAVPGILATSTISELFTFSDIFAIGGPWDLDFRAFLSHRALPLLGAPFWMVGMVIGGRAGPDVTGATLLLGCLGLLLVLTPGVLLRTKAGLAGSLRNAALMLWSAYVGSYIVVLVVWLANQLNFWCFFVLFLALCFRRD